MGIETENNIKYFDEYSKALRKVCPELSYEEISYMFQNITIIKLKTKELYVKTNEIQDNLAFCCKGLLRSFYINDKGEDITIAFIKENNYATDYSSFISQKPSTFYIETLEPCLLINIPYTSIEKSYSKFKNCEKYGRLIAEKHLIKTQSRINEFLFHNAEQRYINFISKNTDILNRISITHLSSFLGIKRQTLTRIRKKLL
ncbi:Crp/Fnr family transcriptional regulator [uncultured Maribacter sp.]|uniref:Crp/Fnr family transcriptional regulator n=1 Tax=uncultured Maribacter sp. TaxID=431308 RepID=UPI00262D6D44|nr:Crp/Fnr family transcriptional regulator [uncultured Maribacter sp.]